MSLIPVIGDMHIGARNDNLALMEHQLKFFENTFFPYLEKNGCSLVFQTGDLFDRRKYSNHATIDVWKKRFFDVLSGMNVKLITIIGNHDMPFKNTVKINTPSLLLEEYSNITIVESPTTINGILCLPWICSENQKEIMDEVEKSRVFVCMAHLELQGYETYRGIFSDKGLSGDLFSAFDLVLSGHFHHKSSRDNIRYVGTPYEMTWNDYGDERGFHVLDTSSNELTFIKNPLKMHNKVHYDDTGIKSFDVLCEGMNFQKLSGTFVKVIVSSKTNPYFYDQYIDQIEKVNPINIVAVEDPLNLSLDNEKDIIEGAENVLDILHQYVEGIDAQVDKIRLETFLSGLYQEALAVE